MYAFKVMVSTLIILLMVGLSFSVVRNKGSAKAGATVIFVIYVLALIAMWG